MSVQVPNSNMAAEDGKDSTKPTDVADDLPTQVFDELSEKVEPVADKGKKAAKGGGRVKKKRRTKIADENLDNLETQMFDGFVPPAPPNRKTRILPVVNGGVEKSEMEGAVRKRQTNSLVAANEMDDLATQVFDAEAQEQPSKSIKNSDSGPDADGSGTGVGKSRKPRGKPGRSSEAELDEEQHESEGIQSSTRQETPKSRRLSSRANTGVQTELCRRT